MKKIVFRIMIPVLAIFIAACQDEKIIRSEFEDGAKPETSFTSTKDYLTVTFTSSSTEAESYYWDFGDGSTSTESSPVHVYAASGTYEVVLKVNSAAGYSYVTEKISVDVTGRAVPYFTCTLVSDLEVAFDASKSTDVKSVRWDFGDGSAETEGSTVNHEYANFGIYQVKLTVTGLQDDVAELEQTVAVGGPLSASYTYVTELGRDISFDASASVHAQSARWDFGDGSAETDGLKITHTFPADGTYHVKLTVAGVLGDFENFEFDVAVVENYNLLKGSDMEVSDAQYWSTYAATSNVVGPWNGAVDFGYADDRPSGGSDGCVSIYHPTTTSTRVFVWQAVDVVRGNRYRYSADIKIPGGQIDGNSYFRFYASTAGLQTSGAWAGYPFTNSTGTFWEINTENAAASWQKPSIAYDGDLLAPWVTSGTGRFNGGSAGVFTANATGTVYVGFCLYNTGSGGPLRLLIDDVKFELIP